MINLFNNKYPYTDFHELNLDWLLETYQSIVDEINEINEWVAQHKIEYEEAIARLEYVENELATFEDQIEERFAQLVAEQEQAFAEQTAKLDLAIEEMKDEVAEEITQLRTDVEQAMANVRTEFEQIKANIQAELTHLMTYVNAQIIQMRAENTANNEYIFDYVEYRLDEFVANFPAVVDAPVYNPVKGTITGLQTAINDLYDFARFYGLTAEQYDSLNLTATQYDAKLITALEYDQYGYIKLNYPDENWYMISPFTGQYVKVKDVVMQLAHFHMDTLTATEYDAKELDADTYDALLITAFDYDWFGKDLLPA